MTTVIKLGKKQNKATLSDGTKLKALNQPDTHRCGDCVASGTSLCGDSLPCMPGERDDGNSVIWVERK